MKRLLLLGLTFSLTLFLAACASVASPSISAEGKKTPKVGHLTGSFKVELEGVKYTGAVNLYCDEERNRGRNLQINWPGHSWHLSSEALRDLSCKKVVDPSPPVAAWNVMTAKATGTLRGVGRTEISFTFSDKGEPGRNDTVAFSVRDAKGELLLRVPETALIAGSNLQAHFGEDSEDEDDGDDGGDGAS